DDGVRSDLGDARRRTAVVDGDRVDVCLQARLRMEHLRPGLSFRDRGAVVRDHPGVRRAHDASLPPARPARILVTAIAHMEKSARRLPLVVFVLLYTIVTGGPLLWVASMSLRTTAEIFKAPYAVPSPAHWDKFADAWFKSNYHTYFWNSAIVVVCAVVLVTVIGAMAAHCLARYGFRGSRLVRFVILSGLILPPQLLILALFQILLDV